VDWVRARGVRHGLWHRRVRCREHADSTLAVHGGDTLPVTILKPLCGAEPETYECLRSFCDQAYPEFQVVFGVWRFERPGCWPSCSDCKGSFRCATWP